MSATWFHVQRILLFLPRLVWRVWHGSLWLRVTFTTLVLSVVVVSVLGVVLLSRVSTGLLDAKERAAVALTTAGVGEAQRLLDAADTGPSTPSPARLVDSLVGALAAQAGSPSTFDVLLLSTQGDAPERGTNLVDQASVPADLRESVVTSKRLSWTYTDIRFLDGRGVPGLIVGAPLSIPTVGPYELYYLFPLSQEQATLTLLRGSVVGTGILLMVLLACVAWVVTRQVVVPVRAAARTSTRLADGHLSERMKVQGSDDLARLAMSFNAMADSLA
ncbi:MAG: HAMP domain-containing protein, partial [Actinomycetes bacterium]